MADQQVTAAALLFELYNVTQNNSSVKDPQYLSDFNISWQKLGKNRPEPARQPYVWEQWAEGRLKGIWDSFGMLNVQTLSPT